MNNSFVHLHVHTQYSILDGAAGIRQLVKRAVELGMPALAITDHGNMFGVKHFHAEATKAGIKPILGCEVYVAAKSRFDRSDKDDRGGDHLVLLAKNENGYRNIVKLVSYSWTEGFYYKPRVDKELLARYRDDIICCSACLGGELPQAIQNDRMEEAENIILRFKELYGDDYYLELQLHRSGDPNLDTEVYNRQLKVNKALKELSDKLGVKLVASNDVHFINAEDAAAHDRLICLNTGKDLDDPTRMRYTTQEYLKSYDEMAALFPEYPEALANTLEVAGKIESFSLSHAPFMPRFPLPEDFIIEPEGLKEALKKAMDKYVEAVGDEALKEKTRSQADILMSLISGASSIEDMDAIVAGGWDLIPEAEEFLTTAKQYKYLQDITCKGAHERYEDITDEIRERIDFELSTIEWMGFPGYFLIVWDFIRAAREMGVSVGPGRGSAAGSVVAYCLGITNIDPLKYNLLFERFLNPERISMPDVDIDFDEDGREEVMKYVVGKYGQKRVAHIITFGTMAAKLAIRDVARVQKLPLPESDRLAKMVPERPGTTLEKAYKEVPSLAEERNSDNPLVRDTLKYAEVLEGSVRQTGVHACGVIIGSDDLENMVPLSTAKDSSLYVVQYDGKHVEDIGLLKMDFLGLKTLSIIKDAVENVKLSKGINIDIDKIPLDDSETYELYSRGDTTGLFQFESPGMKKHLRSLKPTRMEDLIAMNALYRPGPMEYIPNFIARKHGREKIEYDLPEMEEILRDTYGVTVYQEQVMQLSRKLAGFTRGQADTLRKAMGKKLKDVLAKMKDRFIDGAIKNGHKAAVCEKIWKDWESFAEYAFNKSHSTCYAYVSYQTAYLKAHYPGEFMAALLSRNISDIKKISFFMDECKRMGIPVKGPDVNASLLKFSVDDEHNVRFGLAGIKGVGQAAVENIVQTRREGGKFTSIYDFMERVNLQMVNRKTIEGLALAGAFDSLIGFHRSRLLAEDIKGVSFLESLTRYGSRVQEEKGNAQQSLFGGGTEVDITKPAVPDCEEWGKLETLGREKEVTGIYLSSHPLDEYSCIIDSFCNMGLADLADLQAVKNRDFAVAGIVTDVQNLSSKNGNPYGRFTLEDYSNSYQFTLFGKDYENFRRFCYPNYYLMVRGKVRPRPYNENEMEPKISSISMLSDVQENMIREVVATVSLDDITAGFIEQFTEAVGRNKGNTTLRIKVHDHAGNVSVSMYSRAHKVVVSNDLISFFKGNEIKYMFI